MTDRNKAILIGGGILTWLYLRGRNILRRLAYKIYNFQVVSITPELIKLNLNLLINNPTRLRAQIGNFIGNVYINGRYVGNINYPVNRYLLPGVNNFTIGVELVPQTVGSVVWEQLQSGNIFNMEMEVKGKVEVDDRRVNLSARFIMQDFWNSYAR